jgi:hypothetical protein
MTTALARRARPRGFAPWRPQAETLALLARVRHVLDEYRDHLPLTCRQVFYRLVATAGYPKEEAAYSRLCEALNRARRAGLIGFEAIRDDGATALEPEAYSSVEGFLATVRRAAEGFRLDRQAGQPVRLWLMCEASGMTPMLARVAHLYGVPVLSNGGFDSLTAKHDLACDLAAAMAAGQAAEALHIGDHDPSGCHVYASLAEDVTAMVEAKIGAEPTFTRLAVTPTQVADWGLPTAPPKATDRRAFTGETVQAEAIPPDVLSALVEQAILDRQDAEIRRAVIAREEAERLRLRAMFEADGDLP